MAKYTPKLKRKAGSWPDLPFHLGRSGAEFVWGDGGRKSGPKTFGRDVGKNQKPKKGK